MTVRWFESGDVAARLPYESDYRSAASQMSSGELQAIFDELNSMIDGDEIHTSSWMPGRDWSGTVFSPIYSKAAHGSYDRSAQIFGLIVFKTFMDRPEDWYTGRFEKDGKPIGGRTYFRPGA